MKVHCYFAICTVLSVIEAFLIHPAGRFSRVTTLDPLFERPDALANEGDWTAYLDLETTGLVYYFNGKTGESLWEPPTETFPVVVLPRRVRRQAETKRNNYIKLLADIEAKEAFPEANTARDEEEARRKREEAEKKNMESAGDEKWYEFLFEEEQPEPEPEPSWLESVFSEKNKDGGKDSAPNEDEGILGWISSSGPVEDSKIEEETGAEKGPTWLERLGVARTATTSDDGNAAKPDTPVKKEETEKRAGLFERMSEVATAAASSVTTALPPATASPAPSIQDEVIDRDMSSPERTTTTKLPSPIIKPAPVEEDKKIIAPEPTELKPIKIEIASNVLPHPAKILWGGEDAVFTSSRTFGVFDGVSGAKKLDGVPLYSKTLASEMKKATKQMDADDRGLTIPEMQQILGNAKDVADATSTGASTAIVASITEDGFLRALNVGDSGCLVIRNGKVAARAREISHYFECPYQFSTDSPDKPRDGTKLNIELVRGDIIVMASDGVFDNLSENEVLEVITTSIESNKGMKMSSLAKKLLDRSRKVSLNRKAVTPYSKQAQKFGDPDFSSGVGGKLDDASCVLVRYS